MEVAPVQSMARAIGARPPRFESAPEADKQAALFTALYEDLRRLAARETWRANVRDIVGASTLVHEAWLSMSQRERLSFDDREQFLSYAARTMRGLVVDRVRARLTQKRGGGLDITSLDDHADDELAQPEPLEDIGDALDELARLEPELASVVELKFYCGFTLADVARMKGVSERTVQRQWEKARLLLFRAMKPD